MSDVGTPAPALRIGTRGSALALAQTDLVLDELRRRDPLLAVERRIVRTEGDIDKTSPLTIIGGRGVFTTGLQEALRRGEIDAAVHSAKDLPSDHPSDLRLAAFLAREDPRDVLVSRHGRRLADLPPSPTIGTSSRRRAALVRALRPDARIVELRGNVDSRLRKALLPELDGIVLAAAGLKRLGWEARVTEYLPLDRFIPAPGQGVLAVEVRADDEATAALIDALNEPAVAAAVRTERAFLHALGAGCTTPVGAYAELHHGRARLRAMLASDDGVLTAWADEQLAADEPEGAARVLALRLLAEVGTFGTGSFPVPIPGAVAPGPLAGLTVLVTRARDQAAALSNALREQGAEPLELPTIRIEEPLDSAPLDRALDRLNAGAYDWIVFTSANAATRLLARMAARGEKPVWPDGVKVAAVGEATAASLSRSGVRVDLVPARFGAAAVVRELVAGGIAGARVLFPRADIARDVLVDGLSAAGALVEPVEVYRTVVETEIEPEVRTRLRRGEVDVVTFASPSSARNLAALLGAERPALRRATVACIGQVTADAAVAAGWRVDVVAGDSTVAGLVAAIGEYVRVRADRRRPTANGHEDACEPAPVGVGAEA